jgi:formate hydrogenlyase subunit 4
LWAKQLVFTFLLVNVFIPWPRLGILAADLGLSMVKALVALIVVALIDVVNPRLRIDQSMHYFARLAIASLAAVAFAVIGM